MAIVSLDGVIVEANPAMCEMLGYSYEDMIGRHVRTILHPDNPGIHADAVRAASTGGTNSGRGRVVRKDGSTFIGEGQGRPFLYMGAPHILSVTRDVTAEVEAYELLEQRVAERTRELSAVLDVSHTVASTLELAPLLGLILEQLKRVVDYTGAAIFTVEAEQVRVLDYRGPLPPDQMLGLRIPLAEAMGYQAVAHQNGPVIVDDRWGDTPLAQSFPGLRAYFEARVPYARSVLVVPLLVKEQVIGVLRIDHRAPCAYTPHHASLTMAFGNQAAIAIENARLYEQAQDMAALEERQRLARELHDSVTQALYGVTLYAEAATRTLAANDREAATTYLREVRGTAQEALQEMRLLIFELRPPILEQEGLVAALQARLAAVEGRVPGLVTRIDVPGELRLPAPVEEALYRIAQEALNNALKHARARSISLSLRHEGPTVTLEIADDGAGFDQAAVGGHGGFGLRGMAERARQVGGHLAVQSAPGEGTTIRVEVAL
jgi:PAS domain S-box-containing protein